MQSQESTATTCVIFAAGDYYSESIDIPQDAFVIAADGGWDHARALGAHVDLLVGDFDSVEHTPETPSVETVVLPAQKDDPDLLTALKIGWEQGARLFHIYGGLGGRIDHTLSNMQMMALLASQGGIGFLHGDGQIVTAFADGSLDFAPNTLPNGSMISVFSHSDTSTGVYESGLKYTLTNATMRNTEVNGLSNEFYNGNASTIRVEHGILMVVFPALAPLPTLTHNHPIDGTLGAVCTSISQALTISIE